MVSTKLGFVLATLLVAVNAGTIAVHPPKNAPAAVIAGNIVMPPRKAAPVAFEFMGTVEGKIFLLANELGDVDYYTAIQTCYNAGYSLALITTQAQENVVANYFKSHNQNGFAWLDGTDFVTRGEWYSPRTGQKLDFFNWVSGRPVQGLEGEERRCIMWKQDPFEQGWWDIPCKDDVSYRNRAICQVSVSQ